MDGNDQRTEDTEGWHVHHWHVHHLHQADRGGLHHALHEHRQIIHDFWNIRISLVFFRCRYFVQEKASSTTEPFLLFDASFFGCLDLHDNSLLGSIYNNVSSCKVNFASSEHTGCPTKNYTLFWRAVASLNFELGIKVRGVLEFSGSQL